MMKHFNISEQIAVVTGALGKLGPVWIEALLNAGAKVVGVDLPETKTPSFFDKLKREFGANRLYLFQGDVRKHSDISKFKDQCLQEVGIPTILVNNAGIDQPPNLNNTFRLEDIPIDGFRNVFEVNVIGTFLVTQLIGTEMIKAKRGSIINIGSLYATVSPDRHFYDHIPISPPFLKPPAYGASKAALLNLTKYFATHWAPYGIRVNTLSPGGVLGEQDEEFKRKFCARVPMGRMALHEDLAGPLLFLASDASSYVTGINLNVDGGFTAW